MSDEKKNSNFSFKYFQNIEVEVKLPQGFEPTKVYIQIFLKWKNKKVFDSDFEWGDLL